MKSTSFPTLQRQLWMYVALAAALTACRGPKQELAPEAAPLVATRPETRGSTAFEIASPASQVGFLMDAPLEQIRGRAPGALRGELFLDETKLAEAKGLLRVDLDELVLFQQKRESDKEAFSAEAKNDLQNQHARAWLEIGDDAPSEQRRANRYIEYQLTSVKPVGASDLTTLSGDTRVVPLEVTGDFRLHGRARPKTAELEATFHYLNGALDSVDVKTTKPLIVDLEEFDVRPRDGFGRLAQKTLAMVAPKVAREARVDLSFSARPKSSAPR